MVDVIANYEDMTLEFAIRRIDRKFKVYDDSKKPMNLYVCYDGNEPVGNCEMFVNEEQKIAKIEDFDIIQMHQRKGFGSFVMRSLLKKCHEKGIKEAFLLTDSNDTAKDMYMKTGFSIVGQRVELMFDL